MTETLSQNASGHARPDQGNEEEGGGRQAFLFECGDDAAITLDPAGTNLPKRNGDWIVVKHFILGIRNVGLPHVSPEAIIRGIASRGYYIWNMNQPRGGSATSQ